ncbi:MAG: RNA polymerase sigma factor [Pirellulales bacterium]
MTEVRGKREAARGASTPGVDWSAAVAAHQRWMRTVILARLGERQAVDEVLQEVLLAAVKQNPKLEPDRVAPWLYRLAVIQALLYRRKQGRRRKLTERYADRVQPREGQSRSVDPLEWLLAGERQKLVRQALGRLPPRDAEILLLKYTEDWSYHELAAYLGVSHSAVEARLHRARGRLRDELAAMEVTEVTP